MTDHSLIMHPMAQALPFPDILRSSQIHWQQEQPAATTPFSMTAQPGNPAWHWSREGSQQGDMKDSCHPKLPDSPQNTVVHPVKQLFQVLLYKFSGQALLAPKAPSPGTYTQHLQGLGRAIHNWRHCTAHLWHDGKPHGLMTQKTGHCFFMFPRKGNCSYIWQFLKLFWCDFYNYLGRQTPESKGSFWQI